MTLKTFDEVYSMIADEDANYTATWKWLSRKRKDEEEALVIADVTSPHWMQGQVGKVKLTIPMRVKVMKNPDKSFTVFHTTTTEADLRQHGNLTPKANHEVFQHGDDYLRMVRASFSHDTLFNILNNGGKSFRISKLKQSK